MVGVWLRWVGWHGEVVSSLGEEGKVRGHLPSPSAGEQTRDQAWGQDAHVPRPLLQTPSTWKLQAWVLLSASPSSPAPPLRPVSLAFPDPCPNSGGSAAPLPH